MATKADICCIGHITRDCVITPQQTVQMPGGTAYYFAMCMAHLPRTPQFKLITKMGAGSREVINDLAERNIDVTCHPARQTVYFENTYGENANNRSQRVLALGDPFTIDDVKDVEAEVFHLGSLLFDDFPPDMVKALSERGRISLDVQGYLREVRGDQVHTASWRHKDYILSCTDILKLNGHEMKALSHSGSPRTVARELAAYGVKEVIITLGSAGSLIYADKRFFEIPAYPPQQLLDATGCGDTYAAGYLYARSQGMLYSEAGRFAAALCTLKLENNGPFNRSIEEAREVMSHEPQPKLDRRRKRSYDMPGKSL